MVADYKIIHADVIEWAKNYKGEPFHALFCDPPYHLQSIVDRFGKEDSAPAKYGRDGAFGRVSKGFMGKEWDGGDVAFNPETWYLLGKHLYPGAFGMAYAASRGWHRLAVAIEDGGLIIHPSIFLWCQSQGFPKATRIDNQIDRELGKEQEIVGRAKVTGKQNPQWNGTAQGRKENSLKPEYDKTVPATDLAKAWQGHRYGLQALKPTVEPIILFQKPYEGRPVENMMDTGAGALNIDAGRIGTSDNVNGSGKRFLSGKGFGTIGYGEKTNSDNPQHPSGRWPCNFVMNHHSGCRIIGEKQSDSYQINRFTDGAKPWGNGAGHEFESEEIDGGKQYEWECVEECPVKKLGEQSGELKSGGGDKHNRKPSLFCASTDWESYRGTSIGSDSGTASRFFYQSDWSYEILEQIENANSAYYCAKAGKSERNAGLDKLDKNNPHPTVKPIELNRYLSSLLLPPDHYAPNRRILVSFSGVGSEMIGAMLAGWDSITGIEMTDEYIPIAEQRLKFWSGWSEKGYSDPKEIIKVSKKARKQEQNGNGDAEQMRIFE